MHSKSIAEKSKSVSLIITQVSNYRVSFFNGLREALKKEDIELHLFYGDIWPNERDRNYDSHMEWGNKVSNYFFPVGKKSYVCWQRVPQKTVKASDLVIVNQESRMLSHYPLILARKFSGKRIAYWGHASGPINRSPDNFSEKWRRLWMNRADWWFGYTQRSLDALSNVGFPKDRTTCTNNAVDNSGFEQDAEMVTPQMLEELRTNCGITPSSRVGLYCGSLYSGKRLDLLLDAADIIYASNKDFRLIIVGAGPMEEEIRHALSKRPWAIAVGPKSGVEKAAYFKLADLILNPGLIGLIILDAFCMGLPIITTGGNTHHSPEIAYLEQGVNGLITAPESKEYAKTIIELLNDTSQYQNMRAAALASAKKYTQEEMVKQFTDGIKACLDRPAKLMGA
jgi:glycosyltransferase involved in cell wall biosynthesis